MKKTIQTVAVTVTQAQIGSMMRSEVERLLRFNGCQLGHNVLKNMTPAAQIELARKMGLVVG